MKILLTNTGPWGTGSFTVARALLEEYLEMGHEVKLFFPDSKEPSKDLEYYYSHPELYEIWKLPIEKDGLRLDSFPLMIPDPHPRNPVGTTYKELSEKELQFYFDSFKERIVPVLEGFKPDIIECQHIWAYDHIIDELGYPFIAAAHHSDQMGFLYDPRMQPIAKQSARDARFIFALSEENKQEIIELYGIKGEKVVILENGYDRKIFHPFNVNRRELFQEFQQNIPDDAFVVSFAGKLSKTKGIDTLLQANKLLRADEKIHFLILGSGNLKKALLDVDPKILCMDRIHFVGHLIPENVARFHNGADITVMPSRTEGFGLSCLEAMGCGLPAVVTRSGGPEHYAVGEVIEKENPKALADAIRKLKALPKTDLLALSKKAIEVAHHYSWTGNAEKRLQYYQRVLEHVA
ncbi:MAG: glycosyltransferase family 4 protein [Chlamydiales bacterium]|nr:glycosyltransferase family 4 protein [Chlamydiales bacterium]